jgi:tryptophanyl-tRNA synthetase
VTSEKRRILTGITTSGTPHLGNYVGAIRPAIAASRLAGNESFFFLADYHALIKCDDAARIQRSTLEIAASWLACGLDPDKVFFYRQSDIPEIPELTWLLTCVTAKGLLNRAHAYKAAVDQNTQAGEDPDAGINAGLYMYPVLMAADILLQGADEVPVGDDQAQHVELARVLARRFNSTFGEAFVVPRAVTPPAGARIRDLTDPTRKMDKSARDSAGVLFVLDEPDLLRRKVKRAVTDGEARLEHRPTEQPGLANLLEILAACTGKSPREIAASHQSYGEIKDAVAEAVIEELRPIRERTKELLADPTELDRIRAQGGARAAERGAHRLSTTLRLAGIA